MSTKDLAHRSRDRGAQVILAIGVLGMLGFVASLLLLIAGRLTGAAYSLCVTGSLGLYGASLLFGYLSDPGNKRVPAGRSVGAQPGRGWQPAHSPKSSWTWPVSWKPKLSATSRCRTSMASNSNSTILPQRVQIR